MKIGIFGDSFGQHNTYLIHPQFSTDEAKSRKAWWDYLSDDGFKIENNCMSGSSLYYAYVQFKKFYRSYDYNIILVTNWSRTWLPQLKTMYPWVPGYRQAEKLLKSCKDEDDQQILKSLMDYYLYVEDKNYSMDMHKLMCKEMLSLHKKVLLIPCFNNEMQSLVPGWTGNSLEDISRIDSNFYNIDLYSSHCKRHGHINDSNHKIIYKKIHDWIVNDGNSKFSLDVNEFKEPHEPFEHNFMSSPPPLIDYVSGNVIHGNT